MHPIHDVDALVLLAMALAAKRRPAELVEIVAAVDLLQGNIPTEAKLVDSFGRLAAHGLVSQVDGGFALTAEAQNIVEGMPKKAETAERIFIVKEKLALYNPRGQYAAIALAAEQLSAAIAAHWAASAGAGKNLLVPKPKPAENTKRPGQRQRKPMPAKRRKD